MYLSLIDKQGQSYGQLDPTFLHVTVQEFHNYQVVPF